MAGVSTVSIGGSNAGTQTTGGAIPGVKFGGKPVYTGGPGQFELTLGIAPARGACVMRAADVAALQAKHTPFELSLHDGAHSLSLKKLYIQEVEYLAPTQAGEAMVIVRFADQRATWVHAPKPFGGFYNIRKENGSSFITASTNGGTAWTYDQLLQKVLDALELNVTAATGITATASIEAERAPAHAVLARLLDDMPVDLAFKADATPHLIAFSAQGSYPFPSGHTTIGFSSEQADAAHVTPKTLRASVRVFREVATASWEAVLQYEGSEAAAASPSGTGGTGSPAESVAGWGPVADVLQHWGVTLDFVHRMFYTCDSTEQQERYFIPKLGGGEKGQRRLKQIKEQLYRYWRLDVSDRDNVLPLVPLTAGTQDTADHETAKEIYCTSADTHVSSRDTEGRLKSEYFKNYTGAATHLPVSIVDAKDGIVRFHHERPLCRVTPRNAKTHLMKQDSVLQTPTPPTIMVGHYKKFSADPLDDQYTREIETDQLNNGGVFDKLAERLVLRESFDSSGAGSWTKLNQTAVDAYLDTFLAQWKREYQVPTPATIEIAGVGPEKALTNVVRAIEWTWAEGRITVRYRIFSDRTPSRYGLGARARTRGIKVAERAEDAGSDLPWDKAGGKGGGGFVGMFGGTPPPLRDFEQSRHRGAMGTDWEVGFGNPDNGVVLVAEDWRNGKTGKECCPEDQAPGAGQYTRPVPNNTGGGTQVTGGGAAHTGSL